MIAGGAVAYTRMRYDRQHPPSDGTDGRNPVVGVMFAGSAVLGGGVYLWCRDSFSASRVTAGMLGLGVASISTGIQLYLAAEDPLPTGPRYIRDTATRGAIVGVTGAVLTGAGIWLLHRDRSSAKRPDASGGRPSGIAATWTPFVSAGTVQAIFGGVGSF